MLQSPVFSILENNIIQISVHVQSQSLSKAEYISCTVLPNKRTSVYSHQLAILKDDKLHFQLESLPSVTLTQLKQPEIDARTRVIQDTDLMGGIFYPIYQNERVSLQCLTPLNIEVDQENRYCDSHSLQFGNFPKNIKVAGKTVLKIKIPHHFSMRLAYMVEDFGKVTLFKEVNPSGDPFGQQIITFFEQAEPIHYSVFFLALACISVIILLVCCSLYFSCPKILLSMLCCFKETCKAKERVQTRIHLLARARSLAGSNYRVHEPTEDRQVTQELLALPIDRIIPDNQFSETSFTQLEPSQPGARLSQEQVVKYTLAPGQPGSSAQGNPACRSGFLGCFCTQEPFGSCRGKIMDRPPPPEYTK